MATIYLKKVATCQVVVARDDEYLKSCGTQLIELVFYVFVTFLLSALRQVARDEYQVRLLLFQRVHQLVENRLTALGNLTRVLNGSIPKLRTFQAFRHHVNVGKHDYFLTIALISHT